MNENPPNSPAPAPNAPAPASAPAPAAPPAASAPPPKNNNEPSKFSSPLFIWPAAIVLAVVLYFGIGYVADVFTHESTDDAFIAGHITSVAPRIAGQVVSVHVLDNQMVHSNDLLVEIDPADYAITARCV